MSTITASAKSDIGLRRSRNEDAFIENTSLGIFSVADGMGGEAAGNLASKIFTESTIEVFSNARNKPGLSIADLVQESLRLANERIHNEATVNSEHQGMGCTAELIAFFDQNFVLGHVGDSRTYLYRQEQLTQITRDHSLVQEQIDNGILTPGEARGHALRNVILRAVGVDETLSVDLIKGKSSAGDIFLLCSDGLTDMVDDSAIKRVLSLSVHLEQKGEKLVELAKSAGGDDDITVVLCKILP
jgi:PPM family protein phosphatase